VRVACVNRVIVSVRAARIITMKTLDLTKADYFMCIFSVQQLISSRSCICTTYVSEHQRVLTHTDT